MAKRDARKLSAEAQQELRMRAVKMVESGMTRLAVASILEVSSKQVGSWVKCYEQGGQQALIPILNNFGVVSNSGSVY